MRSTNGTLLAKTALFAALITIMTAYIGHIPYGINGGYIHFGDSLIFLAASILPTPCAMAAAAIGGGLADLLTAPMWVIATVPIKMLIVLPFTSRKERILAPRNLTATVAALFISCTGYSFATMLFAGVFSGALLLHQLIGGLVQGVGSTIMYVIAGTLLDKVKFKKTFLLR